MRCLVKYKMVLKATNILISIIYIFYSDFQTILTVGCDNRNFMIRSQNINKKQVNMRKRKNNNGSMNYSKTLAYRDHEQKEKYLLGW